MMYNWEWNCVNWTLKLLKCNKWLETQKVFCLLISYKAHFYPYFLWISVGGCPKKSAMKGVWVQWATKKLELVNAQPPAMLLVPFPSVVSVALCIYDGWCGTGYWQNCGCKMFRHLQGCKRSCMCLWVHLH